MSDFFIILQVILFLGLLYLFFMVHYLAGRVDAQSDAIIDMRRQVLALADADQRFVSLHDANLTRANDTAEAIKILAKLQGIDL